LELGFLEATRATAEEQAEAARLAAQKETEEAARVAAEKQEAERATAEEAEEVRLPVHSVAYSCLDHPDKKLMGKCLETFPHMFL
jgi:hypothetical protein